MSSVVTSFYAERNWRDRFNVLRPNGTRHRGLDVGVAGRGVIPALRAGVVSSVNRSSVLGFVVSVRVDGGGYDGYAHVYGASAIPVGRRVAPGTTIGRAATFGDYTGTAWSGPHLHFTTGFTPAIWQGVGVIDPAPVVLRVLASFANTKPPVTIPDKPKPPIQEEVNEYMKYVLNRHTDSRGNHTWALIHPANLPNGVETSTNSATVGSWQRVFDIDTANVRAVNDKAQFDRDIAEAGAARTKYLAARKQEGK